MEIPRQPDWLQFHSNYWPKVAEALHLLATTGISVRFELQGILARRRGIMPRSGSIRSIFEESLSNTGLIESQTLPTFGRHKLTVVQLTGAGRKLCQGFGWKVTGSEWERMQTLHSADSQPKHTGAVLTFAYHARLRGWTVQVLPQLESPVFYPDVLVEKDGRRIYVEVELGSRKAQKWRNMQREQSFVALCAKTPTSRKSLIAECTRVGAAGMATDLLTLYQKTRETEPGPLWAEEWSS
jgi:hypothetical protein